MVSPSSAGFRSQAARRSTPIAGKAGQASGNWEYRRPGAIMLSSPKNPGCGSGGRERRPLRRILAWKSCATSSALCGCRPKQTIASTAASVVASTAVVTMNTRDGMRMTAAEPASHARSTALAARRATRNSTISNPPPNTIQNVRAWRNHGMACPLLRTFASGKSPNTNNTSAAALGTTAARADEGVGCATSGNHAVLLDAQLVAAGDTGAPLFHERFDLRQLARCLRDPLHAPGRGDVIVLDAHTDVLVRGHRVVQLRRERAVSRRGGKFVQHVFAHVDARLDRERTAGLDLSAVVELVGVVDLEPNPVSDAVHVVETELRARTDLRCWDAVVNGVRRLDEPELCESDREHRAGGIRHEARGVTERRLTFGRFLRATHQLIDRPLLVPQHTPGRTRTTH